MSSTKLLVFQHLEHEGPGRFLLPLAARNVTVHTVHLWRGDAIPPLEDFDLLWVCGGTMDVWETDVFPWLVQEKRAIRRFVLELNRPFLGICLGHQLLGDALNGTCGPLSPPEIGVYRLELTAEGRVDPLFAGVDDGFHALEWHGVRVAQAPEGATVLARTTRCANQAMRIGRHAYGLQFHSEALATAVDDWGALPENRQILDDAAGDGGFQGLRREFAEREIQLAATAERLTLNFLDLAGVKAV